MCPTCGTEHRKGYVDADKSELHGELAEFTRLTSSLVAKRIDTSVSTGLAWVTVPLNPDDADLKVLTEVIVVAHRHVKAVIGANFVSQRDLQCVFKAIPFFWNHLLCREGSNRARASTPEGEVRLDPPSRVPGGGLGVLPTFGGRAAAHGGAVRTPTAERKAAGGCGLVRGRHRGARDGAVHQERAAGRGHRREQGAEGERVATIACIQLRMPLIIIGPPGSSKTLSFQIVQQNVLIDANVRDSIPAGKRVDNPPFFAGFLSVKAGVFH